MDARVDGAPVTSRAGCPVELTALWAARLRHPRPPRRRRRRPRPRRARRRRARPRPRAPSPPASGAPTTGYPYDVISPAADGEGAFRDASVRPNAVLALAVDPACFTPERADAVLARARRDLVTPAGLRTLAPGERGYVGRYAGGVAARDGAYHQGTAWPWLLGAYVRAALRRGADRARAPGARRDRRRATSWRSGQVPEIADGDAPHAPSGCVAQAWSVAELLRALVWDRGKGAGRSEEPRRRQARPTHHGRTMMRACFAFCVLLVLLVSSCGGAAAPKGTGAGGASTGGFVHRGISAGGSTSHRSTGGAAAGTGGAGGGSPDAGKEAGPMCTVQNPYGAAVVAAASCSATPPAGAPTPPAPKAYSGGTCPTLAAGMNDITSMGNARSFLLALPSNPMPNEKLPVIFLWYWLAGSSDDFYNIGDVQAAVDQQRFIAVIPNAKGDLLYNWPFTVNETQARVDEELTFFDDMLSCVSAQFDVNASCVSTVGVSAGALFTDQLVGARSEYFSSFLSLSGGVAYPSPTALLRPWTPPKHNVPALVLWGGAQDDCLAHPVPARVAGPGAGPRSGVRFPGRVRPQLRALGAALHGGGGAVDLRGRSGSSSSTTRTGSPRAPRRTRRTGCRRACPRGARSARATPCRARARATGARAEPGEPARSGRPVCLTARRATASRRGARPRSWRGCPRAASRACRPGAGPRGG